MSTTQPWFQLIILILSLLFIQRSCGLSSAFMSSLIEVLGIHTQHLVCCPSVFLWSQCLPAIQSGPFAASAKWYQPESLVCHSLPGHEVSKAVGPHPACCHCPVVGMDSGTQSLWPQSFLPHGIFQISGGALLPFKQQHSVLINFKVIAS